MTADQLHIESDQGRLVVEYRIRHGHIEVRVPAMGGEPEPGGTWRRLSAREFSAHLALNPALGHWLRLRNQRPCPASGEAREEPTAA